MVFIKRSKNSAPSTIAALDRGLDILLLLYGNGAEMGISEIASTLDLYKSTVHRTLLTLQQKDFVKKNEATGKYWLGMSLYTIGMLVADKYSLADVVAPYADDLYNELGEVINVSVLHYDQLNGYKSVIIYKSDRDENVLSVNPGLGSSMDAHVSSVGKCLLAFSSDIQSSHLKNMVYPCYTDNTIIDYETLEKELMKVRLQGYAIDDEERELGLYCIGAPILNKKDEIVAAISISGPKSRVYDENIENKIKRVREVARDISMAVRDYDFNKMI